MIDFACKSLAMLVEALSWIGRQGTRAVAALVIIGIFVPPIGELLRPFVAEAIFLLLCVSFMRVDLSALRAHLRRPGLILAATAWTMIVVPLMVGLGSLATGFDKQAPELFLGLMLQAMASPMMATPAFAALMGFDATLVLITLVIGTALVPFTAPLFAYAFFGNLLTLSPLALGLKLFEMLAGSMLVAAAIRLMVGLPAIERHKDPIDGVNILFMFVFVTAVMSTVGSTILAEPLKVIGLTLFAFAVFFALLGLTTLIFWKAGYDRAFAVGFTVAQRNIGLMLAATGSVLPGPTWLYFALAQFPIYLSPLLLKPMMRAKTSRA